VAGGAGGDGGEGEGARVALVWFEERVVWVRLSWVDFLAFCLCFDVAMADGVGGVCLRLVFCSSLRSGSGLSR